MKKSISNVGDLVNFIEDNKLEDVQIYINDNGTLKKISGVGYIEDEIWYQSETDEDTTMTGKEFIRMVEYEAQDDCWNGDLKCAPYDRVCCCEFQISDNGESFDCSAEFKDNLIYLNIKDDEDAEEIDLKMDMKSYFEKRKMFVETLGELIHIAKPNLVRCEHIKVNEDEKDDEEIVKVHCENGYYYTVNITANSLIEIAFDVIKKIMFK